MPGEEKKSKREKERKHKKDKHKKKHKKEKRSKPSKEHKHSRPHSKRGRSSSSSSSSSSSEDERQEKRTQLESGPRLGAQANVWPSRQISGPARIYGTALPPPATPVPAWGYGAPPAPAYAHHTRPPVQTLGGWGGQAQPSRGRAGALMDPGLALYFKCAACGVESSSEVSFAQHIAGRAHRARAGRPGFAGLTPNQAGPAP
mmetsp:Transcript_49953/g.113417  ORF Transcript_49953/g.113417 Transcript_49953/m.113417 type:complete len:202 (-) Transcript_49953:47-652(-)